MKHISLFSGIGGVDLGFAFANIQTILQVENDSFCLQSLQYRFPNIERIDDVRRVKASNCIDADIISGGFPCQDVSIASRNRKSLGLSGKRSGLWFEFERIISGVFPPWVVIENVPGLLTSHDGRDFGTIVWTLEKLGYCVAWRVLDARFFGVAQRRRRVFIIGSLGNDGAGKVFLKSEGLPRNTASFKAKREKTAYTLRTGFGGGGTQGWNTNLPISRILTTKSRYNGDTETFVINWQSGGDVRHNFSKKRSTTLQRNQVPAVIAPTLYGSGAGTERVASAGNEADFCIPCEVPDANRVRETSGVPGRMDGPRYRALGNAVCVPVAYWIGKRILIVFENSSTKGEEDE